MDKLDTAYWQGTEPKTPQELREQIHSALRAIEDWVDAADIQNPEDSVMIEAQIFWMKQLLKLATIELKK